MKTKMFFSLVVAAFLSLHVATATDKPETSGKIATINDVRSQLISALNKVTFSDGGNVFILISYDNSRKALVYKVDGTDDQLVAEVKNKINNLKIQAPENLTGPYLLKVTYLDAYSDAARLVASK
jgi:hypothetical protein